MIQSYNQKPRKICVITGGRAEYGLLSPLMHEINHDTALELQIIVTGSHLEALYGNTQTAIDQDGFTINARVPIEFNDDTSIGICHSVGLAVSGIAHELEKLNPDLVVVLGDRFEILGATQAAMFCKFPIAHIHGGEVTEGAMDDAIRHAISKLSHIHFVTTKAYRQRVIQLGELPEHVHHVGAPGLDFIAGFTPMTKEEVEKLVGLNLGKPFLLVTFHPVTMEKDNGLQAVNNLLEALNALQDFNIIITGVNADPGNKKIRDNLEKFATICPDRCVVTQSMGQRGYLSAIKYCAAVVGNSSSGIIEAPSMGKPTVNIGTRQSGRISATSVIHVDEFSEQIIQAIQQATSPEFSENSKATYNPYGPPGAAKHMVKILRETSLDSIQQKRFFDLPMADIDL